jgi:membrane associated rhomboid family serine protease
MIPLRDLNPTRSTPYVNYLLIMLNVLAWLLQYSLMASGAFWVIPGYGLVPARLVADPLGELFTVGTSMFMHGDWAHIGWNMLFLYIFGDNIEDSVGHGRYLLLYLVCGVAAAVAQVAVSPASPVPMVGASGAIAGMLGAYVVLFPKAPISVINPFFPLWFLIGPIVLLPAWIIVGEWFIGNLFGGFFSLGGERGAMGGVAFFAHIGGFLAGLLLIRPTMSGRHRADAKKWEGWRPPPRPKTRDVWRERRRGDWDD